MDKKERFILKRHISPEPYCSKIEKLNYMQENLSIAAKTLDALKIERDKLKESMNFAIQKNNLCEKNEKQQFEFNKTKKETLRIELESLQKFAKEKEKLIQELEKKISDSKIKKGEWKALNEKYDIAKSQIVDREKYIQFLEHKINEFKIETKNLSEKNFQLEKLNEKNFDTEKELKYARKQFERLNEFLIGLFPEYFEENLFTNLHRADENSEIYNEMWKKLSEAMLKIKNEKISKDKTIEILQSKVKKTENTGKREQKQNKRYDKIAESDSDSVRINGYLKEIQKASRVFLEIIHLNPFWHSCFKSIFVCSKRFKGMVESEDYPEIVLKLIRLLIEILPNGEGWPLKTNFSTSKLDSPKSITNRIKSPVREKALQEISKPHKSLNRNIEEREIFKENLKSSINLNERITEGEKKNVKENDRKIRFEYENSEIEDEKLLTSNSVKKSTNSTQTPEPYNKQNYRSESNSSLVELNNTKQNKMIQTLPNSNDYKDPLCNSLSSPLSSNYLNQSHKFVDQSRRNNISTAYPIENIKKIKLFSSPSSESNLGLSLSKLDEEIRLKNKKKEEEYLQFLDENKLLLNIIDKQSSRLTAINHQISQLVPNSIEISQKGKEIEKNVEKIFNPIEISLNNSVSNGVRLKKLEKNDKSVEILPRNTEKPSKSPERILQNTVKTTQQTQKRSGMDPSILRIPSKKLNDSEIQKIEPKRVASPTNEINVSDERSIKSRSKSPDYDIRFTGYSRPLLKEENCWGSVGDYFGGNSIKLNKESSI